MRTSQTLLGHAATDDEYQGSRRDDGHRNVASARIDRQPNGGWQARIKHAFDAETEPRDNPSHWINHRGDAGVRRTNDWQALLDGAQPRLLKMLIRTCRNSEPPVICEVDDPAGPVIACCNATGKDDLIAYQRASRWCARYLHRSAQTACNESALNPGELLETKRFQRVLKWQVFAERHEMQLVVDRQYTAIMVDHIN